MQEEIKHSIGWRPFLLLIGLNSSRQDKIKIPRKLKKKLKKNGLFAYLKIQRYIDN